MKKIKNFFKKLNPMNAIENWVIKRFAKKVIALLPDLKDKGVDLIEKYSEELLNKIQIAVVQFVEKHESESN